MKEVMQEIKEKKPSQLRKAFLKIDRIVSGINNNLICSCFCNRRFAGSSPTNPG